MLRGGVNYFGRRTMFHLGLEPRCKISDDDNLASCTHEKNVCGKVFGVHTRRFHGNRYLPVSENLTSGTKKSIAHSMMKNPISMLSTQLSDGRHRYDEEELIVVVVGI